MRWQYCTVMDPSPSFQLDGVMLLCWSCGESLQAVVPCNASKACPNDIYGCHRKFLSLCMSLCSIELAVEIQFNCFVVLEFCVVLASESGGKQSLCVMKPFPARPVRARKMSN